MSEKFSWSINAGRWLGVPVRIHLFLFLFIVLLFGLQWNVVGSTNIATGTAMATAVILARTCFCDLQSWRSRQQHCACSVGRRFRFRPATGRQFSCGDSLRGHFCERDDRGVVCWIAYSIRSRHIYRTNQSVSTASF